MGTLMVTSAEDGLLVYIDGKSTGLVTPVRGLDWPLGTYKVKVEGYPEKTVHIRVKGQRVPVAFR
jgi:hypothetical protein